MGQFILHSAISPPVDSVKSNVVMQSAYEINLLPGFETTKGANVSLQTKPLGYKDGSSFVPIPANELQSEICSQYNPVFMNEYMPGTG